MPDTQIVDRATERDTLDALLAAARDGTSGALALHGQPGIGKSTLLSYAVSVADGFTVLRARGFESESHIPFAGLLDLLTPILHRREQIPEVQARALAGALALEPPSAEDRFAVPAGALSLLAAAAEDAPVLALVDDAQWLDAASRDALLFAARRLGAEGIVVLFAARTSPDLFAGVPALEVGPLSASGSRELLARGEARMAPSVAEALVATAAGNPLALVELPRVLDAEQLAGRAPLSSPLPPAPTIERAFATRVAELDAHTRDALVVAAAMEDPRTDLLHAALRRLDIDPAALGGAEAAGLISISRSILFAHPLLRSTIYHGATDDRRRAAHEALAGACGEPRRRAWHLAIAAVEPDETVASALVDAARDARARGGHAEAARAYARAAELTTNPELRARRELSAATAFANSGLLERAGALLAAAERRVTDPLLLADLRRVHGRVVMRRGLPAGAHQILLPEVERIAPLDPARAAGLMIEASIIHMMTGDMQALIADAERARGLAANGVEPVIELLAGVLVGVAHAALGNDDAADAFLEAATPVILPSDVLAMPPEIVGTIGHASIWMERWERADAVLGRLIGAAREASALGHLVYPLAAQAQLDLRRGRWAGALADASEAVRLARETGNFALLSFALATLAQVEAVMGRIDGAQGHAKEALALTEAVDGTATETYALHALGLSALARGEADMAGEWLDRAARGAAKLRMARGIVQFGADRVEAHARAGRSEMAHQALEELADAGGGGRWAVAALARSRGILAGEDYEDHFETALAHHEHDGQPFERARTQLAYAERLRRDRRRADARELLVQAQATFERLGATPWAERARSELRATGTVQPVGEPATANEPSPAALVAAGLDELTPQELQIARLVAYGLKNREVAAKLFLSPKTIEYHLSQIYRKLDLRSRTQLATLLASELAPAAA